MATTTVLSQPALLINSVDYSDQCTSATVTINFEALEATSFADGARKYTAGLGNHEVSCTLMLAYGTSEVEENLAALVGTTTDVIVYATDSVTPGVANPSTPSPACTLKASRRSTARSANFKQLI